ncbi:MAG: hypothetical protein PWQ57_3396 [Desulfovibrionales bacterium]|jgi:hypothetical protein|nr:hypothetical protein [Desulfovibrionales bacterium]
MKDYKVFSIKLDPEFHRRLKIYSVTKGVTIKELFIREMERLMKEDPAEPPKE